VERASWNWRRKQILRQSGNWISTGRIRIAPRICPVCIPACSG